MTGIDRLLRPQTIAVIGGGFWGANVVQQCLNIGFEGDIWPVHPTKETLGGVKTFGDLSQLPAAPDATFIGVNRDLTIDVLGQLSAMGAGGAVCFASGFQEAQEETGDGTQKQRDLLAAAGDMTILGPNCYGFVNYLDGAALWPDQHGGTRVDRGVALITQSSNIAINLTMQMRGLPIAYAVTVGNQAQTGFADIGMALLRDERVTALGLHIEGVGDLRGFEALAQAARDMGKPIVALKVGASDHAQAAAVSHTASLAGSDAGAGALLSRLGIGRVASLPALIETLKLLHVAGPLPSNRIASMSCSGGEASLMADTAHGSGLIFPPLSADQSKDLRAALGPKVALANPLDYHTYIWGDEDALAATFTGLMSGDLAMGCVVLDFPRADRCDPSAWDHVIDAVARTKAATGRPIAILSSLTDTLPEDVSRRLISMGIVAFSGMAEAITAMDIAAGLGEPLAQAEPILLSPDLTDGHTLTEAAAKDALAQFGLRIPASTRVNSALAAGDAADRIGYPVALKGEGVAHKTEAGAVALNLGSAKAVTEAALAMPSDTFLVEAMITDTVAELLIGVVADPAHGYVLTIGAGGTLTELLADTASLLIPASRGAVKDAVMSLTSARLLQGYRGAPAADIDAMLDAVQSVQDYVTATKPQEVEINPLMCTPNGAIAADALIRIGD